jgi:hypothetical protein
MSHVLAGAVGVLVAGPVGLVAALAPLVWRYVRSRPEPPPSLILVMLLLLVELRSGRSVLASLISVAETFPGYESLRRVARVALVAGLAAAIPHADDRLRPVVAQLSRAQRSGASLSGAIRRMLDNGLLEERARRIARARTLPVRLMVPVTLLMLPGLVLLLYAPSLLASFEDLTGVLR